MALNRWIQRLLESPEEAVSRIVKRADTSAPCVLNVGGGSKEIALPGHYSGWTHLLLDIDPRGKPDIVCDARELGGLDARQFDAVYCSHNLEHYYRHDGIKVLRGFVHVLKQDGFAEIHVPEVGLVMQQFVASKMGIDDVLYHSAGGPITVHDVIYGWGDEIERSGHDFYAHKRGFTAESLRSTLIAAGFPKVFTMNRDVFSVSALAFKTEPTDGQCAMFGL